MFSDLQLKEQWGHLSVKGAASIQTQEIDSKQLRNRYAREELIHLYIH